MDLSLGFDPVPLIYISVFVPVSFYFDYYSFVASSEVRECDSSSSVLFSRLLNYSGSFVSAKELMLLNCGVGEGS